MSVDCKINLPLYARSDNIIKVIAKLVGSDFEFSSYDQKPFSPEEPSSKENSWHIKLLSDNKLESTQPTSLYLMFTTLSNTSYRWFCALEDEDETYKQILPSSYGLSTLIGKKLVDFFGGRVLYQDYYDWDDKKHTYFNENPKFPKITPEQTSDDRYYQFQNALLAEPRITSLELIEMGQKYGLNTEDKKLLEVLKTTELYEHIDKKTVTQNSTKKKIKV